MADGIVGEFLALKAETDADLLAMQCGDFYEFFADDAEIVGEELDLKVSQKSSHGSSYPMAGVPVDDLTPYLKALVERGYRVAVADQYETDSGHAREVTRVVTPGTLVETSADDAQYLAAVVRDDSDSASAATSGATATNDSGNTTNRVDGGGPYGLAFADITTGRFLVTQVETTAAARTELYRFDPVEILPGPHVRTDDDFLDAVRGKTDASVTLHDIDGFAPGRATHTVRDQFGKGATESVGIESTLGIRAAGAVLEYVAETGAGVDAAMTRIQGYSPADHVELDATTQRNLELVETMAGDDEGSLIDVIDHTVTSPGGRLLTEWITRPRRSHEELTRRQDAIEALAAAALARDQLREVLGDASDLERLASRAASGSAGAHHLLSVRDTLAVLPELERVVEGTDLADSPVADVMGRPDRDAAATLHAELDSALAEDPPKTVTQGGLFTRGYDDDLDELIERHEEALEWIDSLAERVTRQYGLSHVSVDRNKTDGYYIQVGKSAADGVPDHFTEIKTLKNSKRFVTDELAEREREILRVEEARSDLEYELFDSLRADVADRAELLQDVGRALAELDVLASFATHAAGNDWSRPALTDPGPLEISAGRHPVVEQATDFVPNDLRLDRDRQFLIVTGPNMSGKSTYMRQAALITLLAQVGSFVPAREATVGLVDGIYTRVGALDELAQGRSTFMVEMQELSNILHSASADSLVILDEVGRGTATYDGISIAWAATEYLHNEVRAKTLFATHYHELTTLADHLHRVENVHVAVAGDPGSTTPDATGSMDGTDSDSHTSARDEVTFLRTVREGSTDRSYGIHVANLAGVPSPVVGRADEVLDRLRNEKAIEARGGGSETKQVVFDLSSGTFAADAEQESTVESGQPATSDGGSPGHSSGVHGTAAGGSPEPASGSNTIGSKAESMDPETRTVLEELSRIDINETPPVELMAIVQEWQSKLDDEAFDEE